MKKYPVLVTNYTPFDVTIHNHTILARAIDQEFLVCNPKSFISAIQLAYQNQEITASIKNAEIKKELCNSNQEHQFDDLDLSKSVIQTLFDNNITTVDQLVALTEQEVISLNGVGNKTLKDIEDALQSKNLVLKTEGDNDN